LPALELALESKLGDSEESPTYLELSWRPGRSAGFFVDLFGFFELTMVVVRERKICQSQAYDSPLLFVMHNNNQRGSVCLSCVLNRLGSL